MAPPPGTIGLVCALSNDPNHDIRSVVHDNHNDSAKVAWLHPEEGKKSSFCLDANDKTTHGDTSSTMSIDKPAHVLIECLPTSPSNGNMAQPLSFRFGGMEVTSNARNVEAYVVTTDDKEDYLLTARGVPLDNDDKDHLHKSIIIGPSGPLTIIRLHLKLLSLRPAKCTRATLTSMVIKGKLPDLGDVTKDGAPDRLTVGGSNLVDAATATGVGISSVPPLNTAVAPAASAVPLTKDDISAAMTGMSLMVKGVESRIQQTVRQQAQLLETRMTAQIQQHQSESMAKLLQQQQDMNEQQQQRTVAIIAQEERNKQEEERMSEGILNRFQERQDKSLSVFLERQQEQLEQQSETIRQLQTQQTELVSVLQSLQTQIARVSTQLSPMSVASTNFDHSLTVAGSSGVNRVADCEEAEPERSVDRTAEAESSHVEAETPFPEEEMSPKGFVMERRDDPVDIPDLTPVPDQDLLGLDGS